MIEALRATKGIPASAQWAHFLRNHDELDLGRLTHEQREKVFAHLGPDQHMQLYHRGIRRRLAPMLGDRRRIELANSLLFSLPGIPVLYYGDEIGMGDDLGLQERNSVRTPMQWSDEPQAGFSTAEELVRPVIDRGPYSYQHVNVEDQRRDPNSLLNWTAQMIRLRKECPEIGWGDWDILETGSDAVLAMRFDWHGTSLVIVHNFSEQPQTVWIDPGVEDGGTLVNLRVDKRIWADESGRHHLTLDGYGYQWYRVGSLKHLLEREKE